jgi:hypothetical protein
VRARTVTSCTRVYAQTDKRSTDDASHHAVMHHYLKRVHNTLRSVCACPVCSRRRTHAYAWRPRNDNPVVWHILNPGKHTRTHTTSPSAGQRVNRTSNVRLTCLYLRAVQIVVDTPPQQRRHVRLCGATRASVTHACCWRSPTYLATGIGHEHGHVRVQCACAG